MVHGSWKGNARFTVEGSQNFNSDTLHRPPCGDSGASAELDAQDFFITVRLNALVDGSRICHPCADIPLYLDCMKTFPSQHNLAINVRSHSDSGRAITFLSLISWMIFCIIDQHLQQTLQFIPSSMAKQTARYKMQNKTALKCCSPLDVFLCYFETTYVSNPRSGHCNFFTITRIHRLD